MNMNVSAAGGVNTDYSVRYMRCRKCGRLFAAFPGKGKASHGLCGRCHDGRCHDSCCLHKDRKG